MVVVGSVVVVSLVVALIVGAVRVNVVVPIWVVVGIAVIGSV